MHRKLTGSPSVFSRVIRAWAAGVSLAAVSACGSDVPTMTPPPPRARCDGDTVPGAGSYELGTVNGGAPPMRLPDTYPYAITVASATATIHGLTYTIHGRGSASTAGASDVEVFADSGTVAACAATLHFVSAVRDTTYTVRSLTNALAIPLPADFVKYAYGTFLGPDPPVDLIVVKVP